MDGHLELHTITYSECFAAFGLLAIFWWLVVSWLCRSPRNHLCYHILAGRKSQIGAIDVNFCDEVSLTSFPVFYLLNVNPMLIRMAACNSWVGVLSIMQPVVATYRLQRPCLSTVQSRTAQIR